jgi:hypothetical protein
MTVDRFEVKLPDILTELALPSVPDYIDDVLRQTARTRQRPGWTFPERWLPMDIATSIPTGTGRIPWRVIGVVALVALAVALALVAIGSRQQRLPAPFGPASNGAVIFERDGDIYVADAELGQEQGLIRGGFAPVWARDGSRFYFGRQQAQGVAVMTADPDGRNIRQVSPSLLIGPGAHDLSPDSTELAVIDPDSGRPGLRILSLTGDGAERDLPVGAIEPDDFVLWRPGASGELVFGGHPDGDRTELGVFAIRSDGTGLRPLALQHDESPDNADQPTQLSFQGFSLSSDGKLAAYWNWEPTVHPGHSCYIHLLDLATGVDRRMTYDPTADCELMPEFTPDGQSIVAEQGNLAEASNLFVARVDDVAPEVPFGPSYNYRSRGGYLLSPDGTEVIWLPTDYAMADTHGRMITVATGAIRISDVQFGNDLSWQRRAP